MYYYLFFNSLSNFLPKRKAKTKVKNNMIYSVTPKSEKLQSKPQVVFPSILDIALTRLDKTLSMFVLYLYYWKLNIIISANPTVLTNSSFNFCFKYSFVIVNYTFKQPTRIFSCIFNGARTFTHMLLV